MTQIIGIQFHTNGKIYFFAPGFEEVKAGDRVIVETAQGLECGKVAHGIREVEDSEISAPLKPVLRRVNEIDLKILEENKRREQEAFPICRQKIEKHGLDMKLVDVELTYDRKKMVFYFFAEERVDFRELVKDLAATFRTRIELRQIGVRDEAKMLGGLGSCGRPFCCSTYMADFHPVSIKMAKEQGLSLNPVKISGTCGRLMCCLKYEQNAYDDLLRHTPRVGTAVETEQGRGIVTSVQLLTGKLKVQLDDTPEGGSPIEVKVDEAVPLRKDGTPMRPLRPKKTEEPPEVEPAPTSEAAKPQPEKTHTERQKQNHKNRGGRNHRRRRPQNAKPKQTDRAE